MEWKQAYTEFRNLLFVWAQNESSREVAENYPMLRTVRNEGIGKTLGYLESLDIGNQRTLAAARVKFIFRGNGITLTEAETKANARYIGGRVDFARPNDLHVITSMAQLAEIGGVLYAKDVFKHVMPPGQRHTPEEKREFRAECARAIGQILGVKLRDGAFTMRLGDWRYRVLLDFGKRWEPGIECTQHLYRSDIDTFMPPIRIGLVDLMGLGQTQWGYVYYTDLKPIVEALSMHVSCMFAALPGLLDGLNG